MAKQQSPINLRDARVVPGLELVIDWLRGPQEFTPKQQEHGYRFYPKTEQTIRLDGEEYTLSNVHFHRPSEHWVDGVRRTAEMHAVHSRVDDVIRRCVVAVFLSFDTEHGDPVGPPEVFDLRALLPGSGGFYRYEGSLTTPEYDEIVSWVVFEREVAVGDGDLRAFVRHHADEARDPQPLNRRFVLRSPGPAGEPSRG